MERCVLQAKGPVIDEVPLPKDTARIGATGIPDKMKTMEENERAYILAVLKKCKGKIHGRGGASEVLNISVPALNARIKKLGIGKGEI